MIIKTTVGNIPDAKEIITWKKQFQTLDEKYLDRFKFNPDVREFKATNPHIVLIGYRDKRPTTVYEVSFERKYIHYEINVNNFEELQALLEENPDYSVFFSNGNFWLDYYE